MNITDRVKNAIRDIPDFPEKGIIFKDITPLFLDPALSRDISTELTEQARKLNPTAICSIDSRGFLFGTNISQNLDIPLVLVRKKGKLPGETLSVSYDLEYGSATVEMHVNDLPKGSRVIIHDDLLATGGTANAAAELVRMAGSEVIGFSFLINLSFLPGEEKLSKTTKEIFALATY